VSGYEQLKLDNQLCFPLYATSRLITKIYQPLLKELDLTYPQYLIMLVLWEEDSLTVTAIGKRVILETNTITPLLKRLESKGLITREKNIEDERSIIVSLTEFGKEMENKACLIPIKLLENFQDKFTISEAQDLKRGLDKLIDILK